MNKTTLFFLFLCSFTKTTNGMEKEISNIINKNPETQNINSYNSFAPLSPTYNNTPTFNCYPTFNNYNLLYLIMLSIKDSIVGLKNQVSNRIGKLTSEEARASIKKFLWEKKFKITFYLLAFSYGIITGLLIYDYRYIQNNLLWARWKSEYSFEQLCDVSQKQLAKELMLTIQHSNINQTNPTDFVQPMSHFMAKIDEEIKYIERYLAIARTIKKMHLITIFPVNENKIESAQKLAAHAHFVKHIFLSWLAENNCVNNNLVKTFQLSRALKTLMNKELIINQASGS